MYIKYNKAKNYILCEMIINKQIGNNICVYIAIYSKNAYQFAQLIGDKHEEASIL